MTKTMIKKSLRAYTSIKAEVLPLFSCCVPMETLWKFGRFYAILFTDKTPKQGGEGVPDKTYIAIDLKSFYASVECRERGLDPMNTNLVVADESRTDKTICLAVTPSLKSFGIPGRARLFEVKERFGRPTPDGSRRLRDTSSRARPTSFRSCGPIPRWPLTF